MVKYSARNTDCILKEREIRGIQAKEGVFLASERPPRNKSEETHRPLLAAGEPTSGTCK